MDSFVAGVVLGAFLAWIITSVAMEEHPRELQEDLVKMHCQQANSTVKEYSDDYVWCNNGARFNRTKIIKGEQ